MEKSGDKEKFLVGSVDNLQSNCNGTFQENVVKEYYKNGIGHWFDTFMQKMLYFLDHHLNKVIEPWRFFIILKVTLSVSIHTNL